ncbi:MAG: PsbP-related protein [Nitrospiraceae bacterium]|nr:hypothetical protein [Nitrospirota bacterium]MDA8339236.1 PsbP-related protein [Nitrospiraceae bacterium]
MKKPLWIFLLLIMGCAPWLQVGGLYTSEDYNFSVELPQGWMRFNTDEYLLITRDGVLLQNILIERLPINKELKYTKKKFKKGMLPQEVAEVVLDNISSDQTNLNFELIENSPAKIGGFSGFKVVFTFKTKDGVRLKSIYYGFIADEWFYGIRYTAAIRYYFDKDIKTFERVFESFKLIKTV